MLKNKTKTIFSGNLINLAEKQIKIVNYEKFQPTIFNLRKEILHWVWHLLSGLSIRPGEKKEVFYHFTETFDLYVQMKNGREIQNTEKIQSLALACLNLHLKKLTGKSFEKDFSFPSGEDVLVNFGKFENKVLKTLNNNVTYPTIEEFTGLLVNLFIEKYNLDWNSSVCDAFCEYIDQFNYRIILDCSIAFNIQTLDKAILSLFCALMILRIHSLIPVSQYEYILQDFYDFLANDIKVLKLDLDEFKRFCSNLVIIFSMPTLIGL